MGLGDDQDDLRAYYDANAGIYDRWMDLYDRFMLGDARARLCRQARGQTLEVAVGTGLNLPHYPAGLPLTAVDYSAAMIERSRARAAQLGLGVDFHVADAHALEFGDRQFDCLVTALFLSSVPDPGGAVAEMLRVLRPGGRLLCLDHGRSPIGPVAWVESRTERLVAARTGVHLARDPVDLVRRGGFVVEHCLRRRLGIIQLVTARKP